MIKKIEKRFICIIGTDGTGKTTHVKILLNRLKINGRNYRYMWFRFNHLLSVFLLIYCRLVNLTIYEKIDGEKIGYHEFYRSKTISFLYPWFLFLDTIPAYVSKILIPSIFGYNIICDRFIYDTIVDLMIDLNNFNIHKEMIGKLFISLVPKNSYIILLDLEESIIRERRKDLINDKSLTMRRIAYTKIAKEFNIPIIENGPSIQEVSKQINKILEIE